MSTQESLLWKQDVNPDWSQERQLDSLIQWSDDILFDNPALSQNLSARSTILARQLNDQDKYAKSLQSMSVAERIQGLYDSAFFHQRLALDLWRNIGDSLSVAGSYNNMGIILDEKGINDKAISFYLKGLVLYEYLENLEGVAKACNNLGIVNKKQGDLKRSLDYYKKSLDIYEELNHGFGLAVTYGNLGSVSLEQKNYQQAIAYGEQAIDALREINLDQYVYYSFENIGLAYKELGQLSKAEDYHLRALEGYLAHNNEKESTFTRGSLARIYYQRGDLKKSAKYARASLSAAKSMGLLDEQLIANQLLFEIFKSQKSFEEALVFHEHIVVLSDSIKGIQKVKTLEELQTKYETKKKEQELKLLSVQSDMQKTEIKQTRFFAVLIAASMIVLIAIILLINSRKRYKLKANMALEREQLQRQGFKAVIDAEENERKRIAKELHDGLGQILSTARITVSSIDIEEPKVEKSISMIDYAVKEVRSISHNMMPNALMSAKIDAALQDLMDRMSASGLIKTNCNIQNPLVMDDSTSIGTYRIVQEIANNALKYAQASEISLTVTEDNGNYKFLVSDDGIGFDQSMIQNHDGMGLSNIRSRIDLLGGECDIISKLEAGTHITFTVPLQ